MKETNSVFLRSLNPENKVLYIIMSKSLKETIKGITLRATIAIAVAAAIGIGSYWFLDREISRNNTITELTKNAEGQIHEILPSFLLVEQKSALKLTLEKIRVNESLSQISFLEGNHEKHTRGCIDRNGFFECPSESSNTIAIAIPVVISDQHFGYLIKEKNVSAPISSSSLLTASAVVLALLIAFSILLLRLFNRLTAKDIPDSLEHLVSWIESWLRGKDEKLGKNLRFSEFEQLAEKIAEVCNKHEEERNQAIVGQISSGILHDIKNDLQSILAAHCMAEEQDAGSEKRLQRLENLNKVLKLKLPNLVNIVETTLDVNREINLKAKFGDVEKTVHFAISDMHDKIASVNANVIIETPGSQMRVFHDFVQVRRVFSNLISNSLDAVSTSKCKKRTIRISFEESGSDVKIRFEDCGSGLEIEDADLFKAFKSTKKHGTGLGLFNARKIVNAHGGRIKSVSPQDLCGACFEVSFPRGGYYGPA